MWSGTQDNWDHTSGSQNGQHSVENAEDKEEEEEARFLESADWKSYNGVDIFREAMIKRQEKVKEIEMCHYFFIFIFSVAAIL